MKNGVQVGQRLLAARRELVYLREQHARDQTSFGDVRRMRELEAEVNALAWVLGAEIETMDLPKFLPAEELPRVVRARPIEISGTEAFLVEFPANRHPEWRTEFWAAMLSRQQVIELGQAILDAFQPSREYGSSHGGSGGGAAADVEPRPVA